MFINELHYDNAGADSAEAIEVAGPAGSDLGGYSLVLYNGANGAPYGTLTLSGTLPNQDDGHGTLSVAAVGLQNGSPDGVALVGPGGHRAARSSSAAQGHGRVPRELQLGRGDGQGNCNLTRVSAAQAEVDLLTGDPTASGDPDFLLLGDMNAYANEERASRGR